MALVELAEGDLLGRRWVDRIEKSSVDQASWDRERLRLHLRQEMPVLEMAAHDR